MRKVPGTAITVFSINNGRACKPQTGNLPLSWQVTSQCLCGVFNNQGQSWIPHSYLLSFSNHAIQEKIQKQNIKSNSWTTLLNICKCKVKWDKRDTVNWLNGVSTRTVGDVGRYWSDVFNTHLKVVVNAEMCIVKNQYRYHHRLSYIKGVLYLFCRSSFWPWHESLLTVNNIIYL